LYKGARIQPTRDRQIIRHAFEFDGKSDLVGTLTGAEHKLLEMILRLEDRIIVLERERNENMDCDF
jgi:hypothetical protein